MSRRTSEIDAKKHETLQIGDALYASNTHLLQRLDGKTLELRSQTKEVLAYLAARTGEVISKEQLFEHIWGETFVTDDSLVQCISEIRRAVGDKDHKIIQTLPKKGYRLNASPTKRDKPIGRSAKVRGNTVRLLAAVTSIAAVVLGWLYFEHDNNGNGLRGDKPRIAVLPFDDFSAGSDTGYLSDAIAEGIITELARSRVFTVVARNSSFRYRETGTDIRQIGEELSVHYVLEGSQQKNDDALRVTAQLIDATTGDHIWAHTYDQDIGDLFIVQDKIIRTVADRVGRKIQRPLPQPDPDKVTALHYHLLGIAAIDDEFNAENNAIDFEMQRKAIDVDADSHFGYLGLAHAYRTAALFGWQGLDHDEAIKKGLENGLKALKLAPDDSAVHYMLGRLYNEAGDTEASMARFAKAIELNPSASNYLAGSTSPMLLRGQTDEAIERLKQAMGIDPFHPDWYHWQMAWALWEKDQCEAALASMRRQKLIPKGAHRMLAGIYGCLGDVKNAQDAFRVFYSDSKPLTISEQREEWVEEWTAPGSLERFLKHLKIAGMKD